MIRAIFFDLGKVLVDFDWNTAAEHISRKSELKITEIIYRSTASDVAMSFECGQLDSKEFLEKLKLSLRFRGTTDELHFLWTEIFTPIHNNIELLYRLKPTYTLGLISNTNALHFDYIRNTYDFTKEFDRLILSYEVGAMKPARQIFEKAIAGMNLRSEEILFIDDIAKNLDGAKDLGWQTIHYTGHDELMKKLQTFMVII
ncbi:MAG TPA: HAD family phosphatase [bacterium]|nr:HAD family phosphatase [bacterium]HMW31905.1 HAD family phosphatase [bacterium]HMW36257.1 HAD family phosphatase [bacterium]HMY35534.1 HAD family phosphatase [bacterium]HMZ03016.1 HAD family phosphatase [bacterium]